MGKEEKDKSGKQIADKYRFLELDELNKEQLIIKCRQLLKENSRLTEEQDDLNRQIKELKKAIETQNNSEAKKPMYASYNPQWTGIEKLVYVLQENKKVMKSKDLQSVILYLEPFLRQNWDNPRSAILKYITRAIQSNQIIKTKIARHYFYGLPKWFDENKDPLKVFI